MPWSSLGSSALGTWLRNVLIAAVILRFGVAVVGGLSNDQGDFYATLPGAYAKTINPTLWHSEDLSKSWAFQRDAYLYGPTQYLTIVPIIYYFDSYRAIARFLLVAYGVLIVASAYVMSRALGRITGGPSWLSIAVLASTCLFFPVIQAYIQREFEIVVLFLYSCALYALVVHRQIVAAALIAYASAFKFLPLLWVPYLILRRWMSAVLAFAAVLGTVAVATAYFLDLSAFSHVWELIHLELSERSSPDSLCGAWDSDIRHYAVANMTAADLPWALCSFEVRWSWMPAPEVFTAIIVAIALVFAAGFVRLERCAIASAEQESWRRAIEAGIVITVSASFVYAHYYYLSMLIVPLNVLLVRYLARGDRDWKRLTLWACAYLLLGSFLLPPSFVTRMTGVDVFQIYMRNAVYAYGELLLIGLLLWEYLSIPVAQRSRLPVYQANPRFEPSS